MNRKLLIKKIFLFGLLPFIIISIAMAIFGREPVHKFMIYTTPVMLLPLLIKVIIKIKEKKKSNRKSKRSAVFLPPSFRIYGHVAGNC